MVPTLELNNFDVEYWNALKEKICDFYRGQYVPYIFGV